MAALHLVTGYKGNAHVTSADQGSFNAGCVGLSEYVLGTGNRFKAEIVTSNAVRIYDGDAVMQGRHVRLEQNAFLDCVVSNGATGKVRNDIIVIRYEKNTSTGVETISFAVREGTAVESSPSDPIYVPGDILSGATFAEMPLYRVRLSGVAIEKVEPLFTTVAPIDEMQRGYYPRNLIINSDFRCNQRGQTNWATTNDATYTVDMWRAFKVKVQTTTNGIKVAGQTAGTQGYFTQFVRVDELAEKYTICIRADGKVYSFTTALSGTAVEKVFDNFKITALYLSSKKQVKINYCPLNTTYVTIGYIDLFEGTYAYPHVREDYATAMCRCERFVKVGKWACPITYSYTQDSKKSYKFAIPHGAMFDTPNNVYISYWQYTNTAGAGVFGGGDTLATTPGKDVSYARLPYKDERSVDCYAVEASGVISCEPNDD